MIGTIFSLLLITNYFNLKINPFNNYNNNEAKFLIEILQIESANALEINNTNNNPKIVNDTKENEKNIIINFSKGVGGLAKVSNEALQHLKTGDNIDLKNTTLQTTGLSATKSSDSKGGFNFAAAGDWACTSNTKGTVKNIIAQNPELVLALGDLSYDSGAKCWFKIIKPIAEKTKIAIGNHETESSKKLKDYMKAFNLEKQYYSFNYQNVHFLALSTETAYKVNILVIKGIILLF